MPAPGLRPLTYVCFLCGQQYGSQSSSGDGSPSGECSSKVTAAGGPAGGGSCSRGSAGFGGAGRMPRALVCYLCGGQFFSKSLPIHLPQCQAKWCQQQQLLPPGQRLPLPQPPAAVAAMLGGEAPAAAAGGRLQPGALQGLRQDLQVGGGGGGVLGAGGGGVIAHGALGVCSAVLQVQVVLFIPH
ncbi:hypothetical protein COO60DRAFT_1463795 [Scenedesmus sp. NREL 46B-D3]|nr:hypothetical protein COO60DRAFT_1463795 [Scenedesmus sp. NREL 46B-D3]